jgi:hypothetical protein
MTEKSAILSSLFSIQNEARFEEIVLEVYRYQSEQCEVYKRFQQYLQVKPEQVTSIHQIPFLPIQFFKTQEVISKEVSPSITFTSSATTGTVQSKHRVADLHLYEQSFTKAFHQFYGEVHEYCILALLPNYYEREGSSLVYMVNDLIEKSKKNGSGYFLHQHDVLFETLLQNERVGKKTMLIGVSYALLDFLEKYQMQLKHTIIMETGGMKGKRAELLKSQLHEELCKGFGVEKIHSEYGMTELLSQAYSKGDGIFETPPWMKILIRDIHAPLSIRHDGRTGGVNVIDLANYYSCSFIATDDLGKKFSDTTFEIVGRIDNSDVRGCNLMIE